MSFAGEVRLVALRLVELLEAHEIPYMMMGGLTVSIWGIPRATYDVDLTLGVDEMGLAKFIDLMKRAEFEVDPPFERGFRDVLAGMEKIRLEWWTQASRRIEIDVFLVTTPYQKSAFSRKRRVRIEQREMWAIDPADLILHKLVAGRPKDVADVQNILAIQGVGDEGYVREWAGRLGVAQELEEALARNE